MYIVTATVNGRQIPTFLLDPNIQGIVSEKHAEKIAMGILNPLNDPNLNVCLCAVEV
jgi:hypothetical protein